MKMYVIVRKDLPGAQPAVQAGHALAEYLLEHSYTDHKWNNGTLIYLAVDNENELEYWYDRTNEATKGKFEGFWEPDIGNQMTAFAVCDTPDGKLETLFKSLPLL